MTECPYHLNEFKHLDVDLGGAEEGFDLGFKFEKRDARQPFWVLYVSYYSTTSGRVSRGTLHYALSGSEESDEAQQQELLARAKSPMADALRTLKAGQPLQSRSDDPQFV
jgi:hypothetical protein